MYDPIKAKARRLKLSLTADELADMVGVNASTVYRWEAGDRTPSVDKYVRVAAALRVPFQSLLSQAETISKYAELYGAEMGRRKNDPSAHVINTHADAKRHVEVDKLTANIRRG
ncbi:protein of unknown function [Streptomyces murinus]|uniref:helix-turn-helix domain-containing protein n=1 Tax=Streptomyces murinus TaxID=33900 RepID=UPI003D67D746